MSVWCRTWVAIALVFVSSTAWAQALFQASSASVGDGPRAIVSADFDRNGRPDVATANLGGASVTVVLNPGTSMSRADDYPVGAGPFDLVAADFNTDGLPDLAVACADANSVSVLLGLAAGGFAPPLSFATGASPRGLVAADFTLDGHPDLVVSAWGADTVETYSGDGAGGFSLLRVTPGFLQPQGIATGDANRDGYLDIVVANNAGATKVLFGTGGQFAGHFGSSRDLMPYGGRIPVLRDFNHDGFLDLAVVGTTGGVHLYSWRLTGGQPSYWTFIFVRTLTTTGASDPRGIVAADLNGDGRLDLATANRGSDNVTVYLGQQNDWFGTGTNVPAGDGSRALTAADFNRDGRPDLAAASEHADSVTLLANQNAFPRGSFSFRKQRIPAPDGSTITVAGFMCAGDLLRNGGVTAVYTRSDGQISFAEVSANPPPIWNLQGPPPPDPRGCAIADFNRNSALDVAVLSTEGRAVYVFTNSETSGFGAIPPGVTALPGRPIGSAADDFNGDGIPDLAVSLEFEGSGSIAIYLGNGDLTFRAAGSQPLPGGYGQVLIGDFNRDGANDVIVDDSYWDSLAFAAGDGRGGLLPPQALPWGGAPQSMTTADFNEDGILDLVTLDDYAFARLMIGNGDGSFQNYVEHETFSFGRSPRRITTADINRDGHADLVTTTSILFGNGDATFSNLLELDTGFSAVLVLDANHDGMPDILVTDAHPLGVNVLWNTPNTANGTPVANAGPDVTVNAGSAATLDGNGSADPDAHALHYEWRDETGAVVQDEWYPSYSVLRPAGTYDYTLTVSDQFGASSSDTVRLVVNSADTIAELVLYATQTVATVGDWRHVADSTAAGGYKMYQINRQAPKITSPQQNPAHYFELRFQAAAGRPYHLWIRGRADGDHWSNDSVFVQFSDASASAGGPATWGIGTTSGVDWNLEECSGCGESGWGWEDNGWGAVNKIGPDIYFRTSGWQVMRIQAREDGVALDQIVLSTEQYFRTRPGAAKNDVTILPPRR